VQARPLVADRNFERRRMSYLSLVPVVHFVTNLIKLIASLIYFSPKILTAAGDKRFNVSFFM
jgi:hypothetical protein